MPASLFEIRQEPGTDRHELELLGDDVERRYRRARPDVEKLPWGTTDLGRFSAAVIQHARVYWTSSARQEYQSTSVASATLRALVDAAVPLDLSAMFARFPLDELAHAEMCSRFAMELGGGVPLYHDPDRIFREPARTLTPLMRAAELVVRNYCVSEAFSAPMIRATRKIATRPLPQALLAVIARDEAVHGTCGCIVLDWAADRFSPADLALLSAAARDSLANLGRMCAGYGPKTPLPADELHALGILDTETFRPLAREVLQTHIVEPLRARGFDMADVPPFAQVGIG